MEFLADSQKIAIRLSKQIKSSNLSTSNAMKNLISTYNAHLSSMKVYINIMSNNLKFEDLKDRGSLLYKSIPGNNGQPTNQAMTFRKVKKEK